MKHIIQYLKEYKKEAVIGPLFKMLEAFFDLFIPVCVASMIDTGVKTKDIGHIIMMVIVMIVLGVIGLVCAIVAQYFAAKSSVGVCAELREDLFGHINKLSHTELDIVGTSTLINRMTTDINQIQNGLNLALRLLLRSPFIVLGAIVAAFMINGTAGVLFMFMTGVLAIIVYKIMSMSIPRNKKVSDQLDVVLQSTRENLIGARVVRAFCRQDDEKAEYEEESKVLRKLQLKAGNLAGLMNPLTYAVVNIGIAGLIVVCGFQVNEGHLTQGQVVALVNYMSQILIELVKLANLLITLNKSIASIKRVDEIFDMEPSVYEEHQWLLPGVTGSPKIEFKNVSFTYKGAQEPAIEGLNFSIMHGETVGIIGGTGSGKSTLAHLIPRFYDATEGEIMIDGRDVRQYSFGQLRGKIGIVPQKAVLFKGTIRENIKWGKPLASDKDINWALDIAQAKAFVDAKKGGLDFKVEQNGRNLSGGQRQRLTIARAIVRKPEILILDDSTSALDYATEAKLRDAIEYQTQGTTIIVSQRAATLKHADRIICLDDGKVAGIGTHEELLRTCQVYKEICLSQMSKEELGA
ncbi:MAG: ABC transporter ATP-binding protein/permease [Lachnospiraceae bacterium]|nr:ABC transporter ATP-binding protein/permease [Lachnospiraceae bacterium]